MTETLEKSAVDADISAVIAPYEENDDPNHRTHIVRGEENSRLWQEGMRAQNLVDLARMLGTEIVALCGHTWIPAHNPEKFDICEPCLKLAHLIK